MKTSYLKADELSRRQFVLRAAKTCLGVSVLPMVAGRAHGAPFADASAAKQIASAKNVIYLYMSGGMSHLDTFGVVPGSEQMGATKAIATSADGVQISEYLPNTAKSMHHGVVINSLNSTQGAHEQGNYYQHTSYTMRGATRHPSMGAWLTTFQGRSNPALPGSVIVTNDSKHPGAGFFPATAAPLVINNPAGGLQNSKRLSSLSESDFDYRLGLASKLDQKFQQSYQYSGVKAYADVYRDAVSVMKSKDLVAFDLSHESDEMHEAYGSDSFGQGCLLARRLVEHGVRFIEVNLGGWDTHNDNFVRVPERCQILDKALGALLPDLHSRGLLDETLVVLATEFGRTPDVNQNEGRDHYPKAFSSVLWGGGVNGGQVYGKTDRGIEVSENQVSVPDFNATIAYALGLPLDHVLYSPTKRPFTVADKGKPITSIFG
ncbi:DUF1501 domain-containing protein [Phragmitibacter flavus]|uniref:DUF1501 domain-containing protein n=1 Tax=Phragmitibacter flavus TaxID=2576071 RepID=A0A5R8KKU5_9BACT|nr:DUF1501 domain-containing protein [Phragmitibacter flavus]TLD72585.1 DUF1501 domain-containing protein [Phragmitibacter flavus]